MEVYDSKRARVDCLKAAVEMRTALDTAESILARAQKFFGFVQGVTERETDISGLLKKPR